MPDDKARERLLAIRKPVIWEEEDDEDDEPVLTPMERAVASIQQRLWRKIDGEPDAEERGPAVTR